MARTCPHCSHPVADAARMCGFCERALPRRRLPRVPRRALWTGLAALLLVGLAAFHPSLPWNRLTADDVRRDPGHLAVILGQESVTARRDLDYLYEAVRMALTERLGVEVSTPIERHWITHQEVQLEEGPYTHAYTQTLSQGDVLVGMALYVPLYRPPAESLHSLAHEMGHCWQQERGIRDVPKVTSEGFCEWLAYETLQLMAPSDGPLAALLAAERDDIRSNGFDEYRQGFEHFLAVQKRSGSDGVFEEVLSGKR